MQTRRRYRHILIVGGASIRWTPWALCSMALSRSMRDCTVTLYDIDTERLDVTADLSRRLLARAYPDAEVRIEITTDLEAALPGQEVVVYQVCAGGVRTETALYEMQRDHFGVDKPVYTAGPATPIYVAVQAPPLLDLCAKMARLCPDAVLINCANPLPALHRLVERASPVEVYSYCFGTRNSLRAVADTLGIERSRVKLEMTGADHTGVATQILVDGEDACDAFIDTLRREGFVEQREWGRVAPAADLAAQWGYYFNVTHPTDIFREHYRHDVLPSRITGHCEGYLNYRPNFVAMVEEYLAGQPTEFVPPAEMDDLFVWLECLAGYDCGGNLHWVNLTNRGMVPELPETAVLEMECYIDERGIRPLRPAKRLPAFIAALTAHHLAALELAVTAAITHDRRALIEAIALAPHLDDPRDASRVYAAAVEVLGDLIPF